MFSFSCLFGILYTQVVYFGLPLLDAMNIISLFAGKKKTVFQIVLGSVQERHV